MGFAKSMLWFAIGYTVFFVIMLFMDAAIIEVEFRPNIVAKIAAIGGVIGMIIGASR